MRLGEGKALRALLVSGTALTATLVAPVIAAAQDETSTVVGCTPNSTLIGVGTSCSATVLDLVPGGAGSPQGSLEFSSDTAGGTFEDPEDPGVPVSSCTLAHAGEDGASCRLTYVPGTFGTGVHEISASYAGSADHDPSGGSANVNVAKHPSTTSISCAPDSLTLGGSTSACVVTVTDTSTATSTPSGSVALSSAAGTFGPGCETLVLASASQSTCTVIYTPATSGMNQLSGAYGGDPAHETSEGSALVNVAVPLAPSTTPAVKKKCKKKRKRSASAAKKKCKKKKRR